MDSTGAITVGGNQNPGPSGTGCLWEGDDRMGPEVNALTGLPVRPGNQWTHFGGFQIRISRGKISTAFFEVLHERVEGTAPPPQNP